ncbi:hypothetical protein D3C86_1573760 [compost metagenome]
MSVEPIILLDGFIAEGFQLPLSIPLFDTFTSLIHPTVCVELIPLILRLVTGISDTARNVETVVLAYGLITSVRQTTLDVVLVQFTFYITPRLINAFRHPELIVAIGHVTTSHVPLSRKVRVIITLGYVVACRGSVLSQVEVNTRQRGTALTAARIDFLHSR